jgi:predicted phosphodiesterase
MQLRLKILLGYNDKDIKVTYNRSLTEVAKGVIMGHGDEGRLYNHAGQTALGLATRTGKNVVCGHTHRQGISSASHGFAGNLSTLWGMEVGHLCDLNSSGMRYMKEGSR